MKKKIKEGILKGNLRQYSMVLALVLILILFYFITDGMTLKPLNVTNLILQNGYILILAIGMLPVIITARIDLSVGSIVAFVGAVAAILTVNYKMSFLPVVVISLASGALIGAWQGFWTAYLNIPAFITTLSSMLVFRGLTIAVLDGRSIGPLGDDFRAISNSFIPDIGSGINLFGIQLNLLAILAGLIICVFIVFSQISKRRSASKYKFEISGILVFIIKLVIICGAVILFFYFLAAYNGIPTLLILLIALALLYSFITRRTVIGRRIYAIGGNEAAAKLSGINTKRIVFLTFVNIGVLSAIAGIVFAARLNAGTPKAGTGFELDAIASCFIGGASIHGGTGTVMGAIIGCLIMGIMNNGMSIMGISVDYQQAIKGLVILIAVAIDMVAKNKKAI